MKAAILLCITVLTLPGVCQEEAAPQKHAALVKALISSNWSWENNAGGTRSVEEIQFYKTGLAENRKYFTARWDATGPRTLVIENMNRGARNFGKKAIVVFDAEYTHFVGFDFNGRTTVEGYRREAVDPERMPPEKEGE